MSQVLSNPGSWGWTGKTADLPSAHVLVTYMGGQEGGSKLDWPDSYGCGTLGSEPMELARSLSLPSSLPPSAFHIFFPFFLKWNWILKNEYM